LATIFQLVRLVGLHSLNEPSELLQWPSHYDSTVNIVFGISIICLFLNFFFYVFILVVMYRPCVVIGFGFQC